MTKTIIALKLRDLEQTIFKELTTNDTDKELIEQIENQFDDILQTINEEIE